MTLTAERVRQYEARAAAGEEPVLPWLVDFIECREVGMSFGSDLSVTIWLEPGIDGKAIGFKAYYLAADDALAAFAAPLLEREVEGPWSCMEFPNCWLVGRNVEVEILGTVWGDSVVCDDAAEARAIANVRNAHHARRQAKEASRVD